MQIVEISYIKIQCILHNRMDDNTIKRRIKVKDIINQNLNHHQHHQVHHHDHKEKDQQLVVQKEGLLI